MKFSPSSAGMNCLPLRMAKPRVTRPSTTAARVAGVPSPLRPASSVVTAAPAASIAESSVALFYGLGGCVKRSEADEAPLPRDCPSAAESGRKEA